MSRRRSSKQDSLELLLDTICNTFGGVLFIAILVVLLLQQTGTAPASATASVSVTPVEMQSLTARMEAVEDDLVRLRQNRNSQDVIVESFAPQSIRQLLAARSDVTARQEALQADIDRRLVRNATLVAEIETVIVENSSVRTRLEQSRDQLNAARSKLEAEQKSRVSEARMPVTRSALDKNEVGLVLRYGRLYVWHRYDVDGRRIGLNTDDFVVVKEESGGLVTRPKPWAGVVLDDSTNSHEAVRRVLRQFNPEQCYFVIVARPDSFGVFRHLRDRALELGFNYRLMPVDADDPIYDRGGTGGTVQ